MTTCNGAGTGASNFRWRRTALAVALGLSFAGAAVAQSTVGSIFGQAPAASGETVVVSNSSGISREVPVDSAGHFRVDHLPVGSYTVTLKQNGTVVSTHKDTYVSTGGAAGVDFTSTAGGSSNATQLSAVTVTANALPAIDVSSVNSSTIITSADLKRLPVAHSAEAIALLAPNTTPGSSYFTGPSGGALVSFGGSSVSENAYYVNGYNVGEPYKNLGGFQLPYGAIEQQETLTGGYDAKYGRSDGGVINQVGKRGTNEWHFGGQVLWQPRSLEGNPVNYHYGHPTIPGPLGTLTYQPDDPSKPGSLYRYRNDNKTWETVYSAYLGGPLIKDKLFLFLAAESTKTKGTSVGSIDSGNVWEYEDKQTKVYAKLDWNITDNNVLELTTLRNNVSNGGGSYYDFDYDTLKKGAFSSKGDVTKDNAQFYIAHFTSYITDAATLSILAGKAHFQDPVIYGNDSPLPFISQASYATLPDGSHPHNAQTNTTWTLAGAKNASRGLRVDFDYKLGGHDLMVGMDNMYLKATDQGPSQFNPFNPTQDFYWRYYPDSYSDGSHRVDKRNIGWATSMSTSQKAWYLQDNWQVASNVLVSIGVRNDHFTNNNNLGQPFVDEKNQWEPRIGASWDVFGDSSFKVYGNVGRYYLALPNNAAERAANVSTFLVSHCRYTTIDPATGVPTDPYDCTAYASPDGETGAPKDPRQVAARNLKPEYEDEFIVGFDKKLGNNWVYGAKAMWRDLKAAIDDECSPGQIDAKMQAMGVDPSLTAAATKTTPAGPYYDSLYGASYCRLFNPGMTNQMLVASSDSSHPDVMVPMTTKDWGFTRGAVRKYGSLNLYLEHPFDGKWYGRIDYTYSRGFGNTEGQVRSDFGQGDISKTEDWDSWQLMDGQYGDLINVRTHQLRFRGDYQITPEWLLSATLLAQSGSPKECLGYFGPDGNGDPTGYNNGGTGNYHWCNGKRVTPGSNGHTPWTELLNMGVHYRPSFADGKLGFNLDVFNLLNQQHATQVQPSFPASYNSDSNTISVNSYYGQPLFTTPPRTMRFSVTYDY